MIDHCDKKLCWSAGKKTVLCIGITVCDCITYLKNQPGPDEVNYKAKCHLQRGGNASNTCTVLRNLGIKTEFLGPMSTSELFKIIVEDFRKSNISIEHCPWINYEPQFSIIFITKSLDLRTIVTCKPQSISLKLEDFQKIDLNNYGWIHFGGNDPTVVIEMMQLIKDFNETAVEKITVSMEVDKDLRQLWPLVDYCDYLFVSRRFALEINLKAPTDACLFFDNKLRMRLGGLSMKRPNVIVLWGEYGTAYMDLVSKIDFAPAYKAKKVVEAVGAGDTFVV